MTHALPIVDLSAAPAEAARAIDAACTGPGFFYLANHGVPVPLIERTAAQARLFFRQPPEFKRRAAVDRNHRGWNKQGDALMLGATRPDAKEFFSIGLELPPGDEDVRAGRPLRGPNNWPPDMPAFRDAFSAYYDAMGACGAVLLRRVALALGVAEDFFAPKYQKRLQRSQMIYYPPQPPMAPDDQFGLAPHTDFGCITLLWQDGNGGLEVQERSTGDWIAAPPVPGTLVVNVGDLLGRWTGGRYASTPHRVVNRSGRERFSIATFYDPDPDAPVDPGALGFAGSQYAPVTAGEHILGRIERSFGYRAALPAEPAAT